MKEEVSNRLSDEDAEGSSVEQAQTSNEKDIICTVPIPMQLALPAPLYTNNYSCENPPSFSVNGYSVLDENDHRYVGLVNQAMTCYLNSLLQTLYMTPEFRNIIYSLERKRSPGDIQFQLQKLFIQLQTTDRMSLSTVDLTNAFGWERDGSFDQHDVQELFRLVIEALEKRLAKTDSKGCVENLFKGVFFDQIKCLKCKKMRRNEVDFLDLSLAVRPFGSYTSHKTVEEAIEEFIKPEILNGNNQYHCDFCESKEDAEKGLAIKDFPYLLAIQLKRFGFDANTFSRIKLNDRITFPDYIDLNKFIYQEPKPPKPRMSYAAAASAGAARSEKTISEEVFEPESRENSSKGWWAQWPSAGMLFSSAEEDGNWLNESVESDSVKKLLQNGPYIYELFSVLVHQGSAAGGHYYALIKNMDQQKWFDFNDSTVSHACASEVRRTFGDSCGIAYVLMYRRVDPAKNEKFLRTSEVPPHISQLLSEIEQEKSTIYLNIACNHKNYVSKSPCEIPVHNRITYDSLMLKMREMHPDVDESAEARLILCDSKWRMETILDTEMPLLNVDEDCRRSFNRPQAFIIFDIREGTHFFEFPSQSPGVRCDIITADVHLVDLTNRTVKPAKRIAFEKRTPLSELRGIICAIPDVRPCDPLNMRFVYDLNSQIYLWCDNDDNNPDSMYYQDSNIQLYLDCGETDMLIEDRKREFDDSAMHKLIMRGRNVNSSPADPFKNWSNCTNGLNCDEDEQMNKPKQLENVMQVEGDDNPSQADLVQESVNAEKCDELALCQPYRRVEKGLRIRVMSECEQ